MVDIIKQLSPIDWQMLELERELAPLQCGDGKPGFSHADFKRIASLPQGRALYSNYKQAMRFWENGNAGEDFNRAFAGSSIMADTLFHIISKIGIIEKLKSSSYGRTYGEDLTKPVDTYYYGHFYFEGANILSPEQLKNLKRAIVSELNSNGVHFVSEDIEVEMIKPGSIRFYHIYFKLKPCDKGPNNC